MLHLGSASHLYSGRTSHTRWFTSERPSARVNVGCVSTIFATRWTDARAEDALEINRLLTRELHHRVNNNLQLQISLLRRGARTTGNSEVRAFIEHAIGRLRSHERGVRVRRHCGH